MLPSDKFMGTDKDNVFTSFKVTSVDQYNYERTASVKYELEKESGLKTTFMLKHTNLEACGKLFYRTMAQENPAGFGIGCIDGNGMGTFSL